MTGLRFAHGDMRRLRFKGEFDAVVNMFTSFGYFSHRENLATLRGMARALVPGGRLVIETVEPAALARRLNASATNRLWWPIPPDHFILEMVRFDSRRNVLHSDWRVLEREGRRWRMRSREIRLKLYRRSEWKAMLDSCGLRKIAVYGGCSTRPAEQKMAGARLVLLAARRQRRSA
jgi:SAM-dependent methyltransferase